MNTLFRRLSAFALITAVVTVFALAGVQHVAAGGNVGPRAMLETYYNNFINQRNFLPAYQQWAAPQQTYDQFVAGYADTSYVTAYFGGYQAGKALTVEGSVPGVLIGHHYDSSMTAYIGCYDLRFNPNESGMRQWIIVDGDFRRLDYIPTQQQLDTGLLNFECVDYRKLDEVKPGYYNVQGLLSDYFGAINYNAYSYAYNLWSAPRQTYEQFVAGWQDTTETVVFYGTYQFSGTYGTPESGRIPVVLLGYHTDGSLVSYQGCIGVNFNATVPRLWSIYDAYLSQLAPGTVPTQTQIQTALNARCY